MNRARPTERAVILLVVLVTLVGLCGATVALTRIAASAARAGAISVHSRMADAILRESEGPIHDWLMHSAPSIVLAPDSREACVLVLDDVLVLGGVPARVRIAATDACGPERINLSTFPMAEIRKAMLEAGLGGIELVERDRADGRVPSRLTAGGRRESGERVVFVSESPRWSMRVTIRVGRVERAWVSMYAANERGWECQERRLDHE